jgi:hypothetical protein
MTHDEPAWPRRKPALFKSYSTHDEFVVHCAWAILRGHMPAPKTNRAAERAIKSAVDFLFEDVVLGGHQ